MRNRQKAIRDYTPIAGGDTGCCPAEALDLGRTHYEPKGFQNTGRPCRDVPFCASAYGIKMGVAAETLDAAEFPGPAREGLAVRPHRRR